MKNKEKQSRNITLILISMMVAILVTIFAFSDDKELQKEVAEQVTNTVTNIVTYEMSEEEIKELPSTEIIEQTEEQENAQEQAIEDEGLELQGEIAYEGDRAVSWDIELGDYKALTYYNQTDVRWRFKNVQLHSEIQVKP